MARALGCFEEAALVEEARLAAGAVAPVVIQAVGGVLPLGGAPVLGKARRRPVAAVEPVAPARPRVLGRLPARGCHRYGRDPRPARRAAVDAVGQETHLEVAALAGVNARGVGKRRYRPKRGTKVPAQDAAAQKGQVRVVARFSISSSSPPGTSLRMMPYRGTCDVARTAEISVVHLA